MTIPLQRSIIYGPVRSRRLGFSLGLNLLSWERKTCNFDCLYCQYGWTPPGAEPDRPSFAPPERVLEALEEALAGPATIPGYLTFSGNGEPTLHPRFPEIVEGVTRIRDRLAPRSRTAILSNSSTLDRPEVVRALAGLDVRIMKLDAGSEAAFKGFNRARAGLSLKGIVRGLAGLEKVTIQTLLAGGPQGNSTPSRLREWTARLEEVRPLSVQLHTLARPAPSAEIRPLSREELEEVGQELGKRGIGAEVF